MRKIKRSVLAGALMLSSSHTYANNLAQSPEIFYPNSSPRGDFIIRQTDVVLKLPIIWATAARIDQPVILNVAGKTRELAAGAVLPQAEGTSSTGISGFCTPLRHGERKMEHGLNQVLFGNGLLARHIAQNRASEQFCLFDTDGDGQFDEVRYFDSGSKNGSQSEKLSPVRFTKIVNTPVSASDSDQVRVTASHIGSHSLILMLDFIQSGQARVWTSLTSGGYSAKRLFEIDLKKPLPQTVAFFGINLDIVAMDQNAKAVTVRFPENVDRNRIIVIPEETQIHYCFGYGPCG